MAAPNHNLDHAIHAPERLQITGEKGSKSSKKAKAAQKVSAQYQTDIFDRFTESCLEASEPRL